MKRSETDSAIPVPANDSEDAGAVNRLLRILLMLAIATLVMATLWTRYAIWREQTSATNELVFTTSQLEELQTQLAENKTIPGRVDRGRSDLRTQETDLEYAFRSFDREEMATRLLQEVKVSPHVGILYVNRSNSNYVMNNFMYVPAANQSLVVYLKKFSKDDSYRSWHRDFWKDHDHLVEVPLPSHRLFEMRIGLENEPNIHFVLQVDGQEPTTVPLFSDGEMYGYSTSGADDNHKPVNFFSIGEGWGPTPAENECRKHCLEHGIWKILRSHSFSINRGPRESAETTKLRMRIALKSAGPFYTDGNYLNSSIKNLFQLTWDQKAEAFQISAK